jgi:hypothetical protein
MDSKKYIGMDVHKDCSLFPLQTNYICVGPMATLEVNREFRKRWGSDKNRIHKFANALRQFACVSKMLEVFV